MNPCGEKKKNEYPNDPDTNPRAIHPLVRTLTSATSFSSMIEYPKVYNPLKAVTGRKFKLDSKSIKFYS